MASLASVTPGSSYPGLIKTIDNLALTGCSQLSDGCGNALPISISPAICALNFGATGNVATGCNSFILNGSGNCALGAFSIISGNNQCAIGADSVILGGYGNKAYGYNSTIFGARNTICSLDVAYHSTIAAGADNIIEGALGFIGGGIGNKILGCAAFGNSCNAIVSGEQNCIVGSYTSPIGTNFIGGGRFNRILAGTTICVNSVHSTISGGCANCILGVNFGTIPGGAYNVLDNGTSLTRLEGSYAGGGVFNRISANYGAIIGGSSNCITGYRSGIVAGENNLVTCGNSGVFNGMCNTVGATGAAIIAGCKNTISGTFSAILSGANNCAIGDYSTIFGGQLNSATCANSGVFGCGITSSMSCAFHTNRIVVTQLPSSSAGLPSGAMWYDPAAGNVVKYVP
jgi:hypothetical protein